MSGTVSKMIKRLFRLQYVSDMHLEFHDRLNRGNVHTQMFIVPDAPYLALCGDIGFPERPALQAFLATCSKCFKEVFWVPGNHEFYNFGLDKKATYEEKLEMCEKICDGFKNVHFMHRKVRQIPGWNLRIAGCTLWSKLDPANDFKVLRGMNDVRQIYTAPGKNAEPNDFRRWHQQDKEWLTEQIRLAAVAQEDLIVLTHHMPTFELIHPKYKDHPLNFCFASNLEQMIQPPVRAWLCGHSHAPNEVSINGIPCSLNPHGYPGESVTTINRQKILELKCDSYASPCDSCGQYECYCGVSCFGEHDD